MINFMIGSLLSAGVLVFGVMHSKTSLGLFLNAEGIVIVMVGSVAIFFMANRLRVTKAAFSLVTRQIFGLGQKRASEMRDIIILVSQQLERGQSPTPTGHELLDKGLAWIQAGLDEKRIEHLIQEYASTKLSLMDESTNAVIHLGKYPPALGMIGTVFGIIGIFSSLGAVGAVDKIGPNLGVAMTATLYGLVVANFFIQPLGELLAQSVDCESRTLRMTSEAIKLWKKRETTFFIKEQMELYERAA